MALQVFNSRVLPFLPLPQELVNPALQLARLHGELSSSSQTSQRYNSSATASSVPLGSDGTSNKSDWITSERIADAVSHSNNIPVSSASAQAVVL